MVQPDGAGGDGVAKRTQVPRRTIRDRQTVDCGSCQFGWRWERVAQSHLSETGDRSTESGSQFAKDCPGGCEIPGLSGDDAVDADFERVPGIRNMWGVVETEDPASPTHQVQEPIESGEMGNQQQLRCCVPRDLDDARRAAFDSNRAPIDRWGNTLHRWYCPIGEILNRTVEVEILGVGEADRQAAVCLKAVAGSSMGPELARGGSEDLEEDPVELPNAAEPCGERDLDDPQIGVVEQSPGKMRPARTGELVGGDAEMFDKETSQMPRRHIKASGKPNLGGVIQRSVGHELHAAAHQLGAGPSRFELCSIRTAP